MSRKVEVVVAAEALLGEGPVWDPAGAQLLWVDIWRHELHRYDPATGEDAARVMPGEIAAVALCDDVGLVAAVGSDVVILDDHDDVVERLATLPTGERANDGKPDPRGRLLIGTLAPDNPGSCALYQIDGPDRATPVIDGLTISNGLDWSPDGRTMYFADTPTCKVEAFDYDPDAGVPSARRTFVDLTDVPGRPDGLTVDAEGGLWVTMARAGQIRRFDTGGRLLDIIDLPAPRVTSCAFGGPDLDELYVTSGRFDMTPTELGSAPHSGSLFRIRPGVTGQLPHRTNLVPNHPLTR